MIKTNAVLFLVFMTATTIVSATPSIQVRGSLSLEDTSTKLSLHVRDETSYQYRLDDGALSDCERPVRPEVLCEVPVTPGIHDLQLVITAPGYKTFFRTLARLQIGNENIAVDLENLKLIPSELKVVQVLKKVSSGGGAEFEINLHQGRTRDINITEIRIFAKLDEFGNCGALTTPVATFTIKDKFVLTSRGGTLTGKASENGDATYQLPVDGVITARQCPNRMRVLHLTLKTAIGVRAKDAVLVLKLPPKFKIVSGVERSVRITPPSLTEGIGEPTDTVTDTDTYVADPKDWGHLSLVAFREFIFQLRMTGAEDGSIIARYPTQ
jgi:hypothetical protein